MQNPPLLHVVGLFAFDLNTSFESIITAVLSQLAACFTI
jgi:hypothetical protein